MNRGTKEAEQMTGAALFLPKSRHSSSYVQ